MNDSINKEYRNIILAKRTDDENEDDIKVINGKKNMNDGINKEYRNNVLFKEIEVKNGKKDGIYKEYFKTGTIYIIIIIKNLSQEKNIKMKEINKYMI
jgi:antitoxin component YwqK of YwqJK toxin-antitoxin module